LKYGAANTATSLVPATLGGDVLAATTSVPFTCPSLTLTATFAAGGTVLLVPPMGADIILAATVPALMSPIPSSGTMTVSVYLDDEQANYTITVTHRPPEISTISIQGV